MGSKILISAIACAPGAGSEGAVGWEAVKLIARDRRVVVFTHERNREAWKRAALEGVVPCGIEAAFLGGRGGWHPNRLIARAQSWISYMRFGREALSAAVRIVADKEDVLLAHQLTYATWRVPSALWRLPVPFVWGPVGGAGRVPDAFRRSFSPQGRAMEAARDIQSAVAERSRAFRACAANASCVLSANRETTSFLRRYRGERGMIEVPVAFASGEKIKALAPNPGHREGVQGGRAIRLFAGGNMIASKGLRFALKALAIAKARGLGFHYTVAGGGPEISDAKMLAAELGLAGDVTFHSGFSGVEYFEALRDSDVYFLPSLRETTPVTMMEAMLAGCQPVVADIGGAGEMARNAGDAGVAATDPGSLVEGLADELCQFQAMPDPEREAKRLARARGMARVYSADAYLAAMRGAYDHAMEAGPFRNGRSR